MKYTILIVVLMFSLTGCTSGDKNNFTQKTMDFTTIGKGELHGNEMEAIESQNMVISDKDSWAKLMAQMNTTNHVTQNFTETTIDFSRFMVLAVFDEIQLYGGYSIRVADVSKNKNSVIIAVENTSERGINPVVNLPFHIVKIPIIEKPIVFE